MALVAGTLLGPYEIQALAGAGGMGEVYRARDTRLNRIVAIKVLPNHAAFDPVRRERFEREAQAASALDHPNICALYDIGRAAPSRGPSYLPDAGRSDPDEAAIDFLVMEYCDGETLAERLAKRPLRFGQMLKFAIEIAEGVHAAHSHGFVHGDLKPANIMLTSSGVKLLDFGLTRLPGPSLVAPAGTTLADADTDLWLSADGAVAGTVRYMAPEQLEGGEVDARADIFALGAIFYEMAAGRRAFDGESQVDVIAAIVECDPPPMWHVHVPREGARSPFERVIGRCLAKSPNERWQNASDLATELKWIAEEDAQGAAASARRGGSWWLVMTSVTLAVLITIVTTGVLVTADRRQPAAASGSVAFEVSAPEGTTLSPAAGAFAVSPDGRYLAFVASGRGGVGRLWIRSLDSLNARELPNTEGALGLFWSTDGRHIGFFKPHKLESIAIAGGPPILICDVHGSNRSGSWNRDGIILFSGDTAGGGHVIHQVSASGGTPVPVTRLDEAAAYSRHALPAFLPDGRHFLYLAQSTRGDHSAVFLASLDSGTAEHFLTVESQAVYAEPGFLLFRNAEALMAQPFDAMAGRLSGAPRVIVGDVGYNPSGGHGMFSLSQTGVLTYRVAPRNQLVWFDRHGNSLGTIGIPGRDIDPVLSPDGTRVAVSRFDSMTRTRQIWILDVRQGIASRLTFGDLWDVAPTWAPDASRIIYASGPPTGFGGLYQTAVSGSENRQRLEKIAGVPEDWASQGRFIIYSYRGDLWVQPQAGTPQPLFQSSATERHGQLSPDGRWIAYSSNESGRYEVFVRPFPAGPGQWQVSVGGGIEPKWRRDGRELFYLAADQHLMAVQVKAHGNSFQASSPVALFLTRADGSGGAGMLGRNQYTSAPDGQRFLINQLPEDKASRLRVMINWTTALKE